ncbi:Protein-arginine deiminase type-3 [Fusarium odoratissimum]|uniref:Protein-arginine deiminase type-3 n=1 Tax=Fusarium oxysporum f. sp. cubense (strain race 4) TaxID=2502994 RepID=N1S2U6_FUSC4|nr:Protein-arginine deiminase type-3 [Fusarium odoratissimum]
MRCLHLLALCGFPLALSCPSDPRIKADIRADTNRDGQVDLDGLSDANGKTRWTEKSGAIFLPNIGDTDRRCSKQALAVQAVSNEELDDCNDASDNTQRSPEYLAPLKTVPITTLFENANGTVTVPDAAQRKFVRIFQKQGKDWVYIDNNHTFSQQELQAGLDLGIDARDTRRPDVWDGRVTVRFTVQVGDTKSSDTVMLRVAPVLTHHHLQKVEQVLASQDNGNPYLVYFTNILASIAKAAGLKKDLYLFNERSGKWAQDFVEPGYASMPGPNGTVSIRIMIRCPGDEREGGRQLFLYFRKAGVGAVQHLGKDVSNIDAGGNIEAIPPYTFKGKIGHVDEFLQFIPAKNKRGWVAVISDPRLAIKLLEDEQKARHGSLPAISRKDDIDYDIPTITQLLGSMGFMKLNRECAQRIDGNIETLRREVGLADEDIIRIPALFNRDDSSEGDGSKLEVGAFYPAVINNLVLTGYNTCVAPNPWGPVVEGKDVLAKVISDTYAMVGMKIKFIDDWDSHHEDQGGVHCGTNSIRDMSARWW